MSDRILRARVLSPSGPDTLDWLDDARVRLAHGRITEVCAWSGGPCDEDVRHGVLTPGFVDAHVHAPQLRIVGAASGPLLPWLSQSTFPEEGRFADATHARRVYRAFTSALAASGTTLAFVYGSVHPAATDLLFDALDEAGLKAIAGPVLMDEGAPPGLTLAPEPAIEALAELHARWHGHDDRLQLAVIPRFALSCSADLLARAGAFARGGGLWVSTHLSENQDEVAAVKARFAARDYLRVYEDAGLVHDRAVFAHCLHPSPDEWRRLADADAVIAHCPDSNAFLGSGDLPLGTVLDAGLRLTLGTDVAAGRSWRVPRTASHAHDNALRVGRRLPAARWLWTATRGAALALGHDRTGAIAAGLDADLVLHDVPAWVESAEEALGWILFATDAPWPHVTWVRGRRVWDRARLPAGGGWPWDVDSAT